MLSTSCPRRTSSTRAISRKLFRGPAFREGRPGLRLFWHLASGTAKLHAQIRTTRPRIMRYTSSARRGVAQPGSAPALGAGCRRFESCRPDQSRVWFNGRTEAFQASNAGSIPVTRSNKTSDQSLIGSDFFVCASKCAPSSGPNANRIGKKLQTLLFRALHTGSCLLGRAPAFNCASDPPKAITGRSYILMRARDCSFSSMTLSWE